MLEVKIIDGLLDPIGNNKGPKCLSKNYTNVS